MSSNQNTIDNKPFPFTDVYEDAVLAKKENKLDQWIQSYLLKEGNIGLATALKTKTPKFIDLVEIPLSIINKIEGPEPVGDRESLDIWEERVSGLAMMIGEGYIPPPLIVTDFWRPFEIVDGNHRHEALLRNNIQKYWTVFLLKDEANIDELTKYINGKK